MKANRTWYVDYRLYKKDGLSIDIESFTFCPNEKDITDVGLELMANENAIEFTHGHPYQLGKNRNRIRLTKGDAYYDKQGKMVGYRYRNR